MTAPNIVLVVIDTLRRDLLGCYGAAGGLTPHIDRLATEGLLCTQAVTSGTWTQAAMPGILTSTHAALYNGCLGPLAAERPAAVEALGALGYRTGGFVTNPLIGRAYAYDRGFQHFADLKPGERDPGLRKMKGGQVLLRHPAFHTAAAAFGKNFKPAKVYTSGGKLVDAAAAWLKSVDEPFFAWLHFMDVHWPYHLDSDVRSPQETAQAWRDLHHFHAFGWKGAAIGAQQAHRYRGLYEKALQYLDAQIGRLIAVLETAGKLANTAIILTADHGEEFLEHGRWGHWENNLFDEIVRVPLVVRLPGGRSRVICEPVQTLDIMPTALELAGGAPLSGMAGQSLLTEQDEQRITLTEMPREDWHRIALRTPHKKMIFDSRRPDAPEFYDLVADPGETSPLAESDAAERDAFEHRLREHLSAVSGAGSQTSALPPTADEELIDRLRRLGYLE